MGWIGESERSAYTELKNRWNRDMTQAVTEHLVQLIAKQVDNRGIVVWYDQEQAYGTAVADLALPSTTIAR